MSNRYKDVATIGQLVHRLATEADAGEVEIARLNDLLRQAYAEIDRLTYDRNHPYGEVANVSDTRSDCDVASRGRIFQRLHVGTDTLCAHVQTDCCPDCPQWATP